MGPRVGPGTVQFFILGALSVLLLQSTYQWLDPVANCALRPSIESIMRLSLVSSIVASFASFTTSTILQNGQVRETHFLDTKIDRIDANSTAWRTYGANATELSYKGRWDSKHISWWAAPGLKFGFTGQDVAITFGEHTSPGVLVAFRIGGLDWQFTNISASSTHHLVSPSTPGINTTLPTQRPLTFELRVTNWAYGIQVSSVHVSTPSSTLIKIPNHAKTIEFIGDSLTAGMYATYEALSGFGHGIGAGLGNVEYSITAYPGICLHDAPCWGNPRGQTYQWLQTSDTSPRAAVLYGIAPEPWDFTAADRQPADLVIINLGTNDNNTANNVSSADYYASYVRLINSVHATYPDTQIVIMSLWNGFSRHGNSYATEGAWVDEIWDVYSAFQGKGEAEGGETFVHYFNSTGVLQHNDIGPLWHPTDVGHVKIASHMLQYIHLEFGWDLAATGPEVQHETLYWNDQSDY